MIGWITGGKVCKTNNSIDTRTNEYILEEINPLTDIQVKAHKNKFVLKYKKSADSKKFRILRKEFKNPRPSYLLPLKCNNENKQPVHEKSKPPKEKG